MATSTIPRHSNIRTTVQGMENTGTWQVPFTRNGPFLLVAVPYAGVMTEAYGIWFGYNGNNCSIYQIMAATGSRTEAAFSAGVLTVTTHKKYVALKLVEL